jgi:replicative DNA helicase
MAKQSFALKEIWESVFPVIERLHEQPGALSRVATGFAELDEITAGLHPSDMITIAGRPGMGKTAFALCITRNVAIKDKTPVIYFSLETKAGELVERLIANEAKVSGIHLQTGKLSDEEWQRITAQTKNLSEAPLYIDDTPALSIRALQEKSRKAKKEHGMGLIIIDCLQLMTTSEPFSSRKQEINAINQSIKALAYELEVPVVVCSHMLPTAENRTDKRPTLADLGCGNLEQISDAVILIYRPEVYGVLDEDGNTQEGVTEIIVSKKKDIYVRTLFFTWVSEFFRFEEPELYHIIRENAHSNRTLLKQSDACGCVSCLEIFNPNEIEEWFEEWINQVNTGEGTTAMCPKCGMYESLVPYTSGIPLTRKLLKKMHRYISKRRSLYNT